MAIKTVEISPQRYARLGGALYLAIIVLGAFAEGFVANKLLVPGDVWIELVLLAVLFNLVSLAVEAISKLFLLVFMPTLRSADSLRAFEPQQLQGIDLFRYPGGFQQ